ncbi:MAG: hypothetical protein WAQ27_05510 [Candidatus Microsaccharimonas sp.]
MVKRLLGNPVTWIILVLVGLGLIGAQFRILLPIGTVFLVGIGLYLVWLFFSKRKPGGSSRSSGPFCTNCGHTNHGAQNCISCRCVSS